MLRPCNLVVDVAFLRDVPNQETGTHVFDDGVWRRERTFPVQVCVVFVCYLDPPLVHSQHLALWTEGRHGARKVELK